jgi:acetyl esterase/lipase
MTGLERGLFLTKRYLFKRSGYISVGIILLFALAGCARSTLLALNAMAYFDDYTVIEDVAYGEHALNRLNIYLPARKQASRATAVFFYGGCWGGCATINKDNYRFVAQALTAHGYTVVIADYRRYPEVKFAQIMADASQSVIWVKAHIAEYGGDPEQIFLMGHSAGAHLAAMLTLNKAYLPPETYQSIKGFIGLAGPYDFLPFTEAYQKEVFGPEKNYPASQPVNFVQGTEPPLLLLYGNNDVTVKPVNIESLSRKVRQAGGCVETHRYAGLDHAELLGALSLPLQNSEPVLSDIIRFLDYYSAHERQDFRPTVNTSGSLRLN